MASLISLIITFLFPYEGDPSGAEFDYDERDVSGW